MLMVSSNGASTVRPTPEGIRTLMDCDEISTFSECGWFCAVGYRDNPSGLGRDRAVALHFNSRDEYLRATGQAPEESYEPYSHYRR